MPLMFSRSSAVTTFSLAVIFSVFIPAATFSTTLTVRQDGTGQFTTINAAKDAAFEGDVIEVGPGVYPEEVDFSIAVTLVSTDGAAATILDGENVRRLLIFRAGDGSVVDGFTLRNGYQISSGAALRVQLGATATARNCIMEHNIVDASGGAVVCRDLSRLDMEDCVLESNQAVDQGGAIYVWGSGTISLTRCVFRQNHAAHSGAISTDTDATLLVYSSLFVENNGDVAAINVEAATSEIMSNTFYSNIGDEVLRFRQSTATVRQNLIVGNTLGSGVSTSFSTVTRSCNLFWSNGVEDVLTGTEIIADPIFCDVANGDFSISLQSPAAPANSPCGELMGAYDPTCDIGPPPPPVVEPVILTITDVPNDQGFQVRIRWQHAKYDAPDQPTVITGYAIYRHQGAFVAGTRLPEGERTGTNKPALDGWDYIATVPARGDDIYQYVSPTLCNQPKNGDPCWSVFFVSALTPDPLEYFDSAPDSGYSVDNLPPGPPGAVALDFSGAGAALEWEASPDGDVNYYRIYRATGEDPVPGDATLVHTTGELAWVDPDGTANDHYLVSAVDINGNEGEPAGPGTITAAADVVPERFALRQNWPNPFNPSTRITFDVPAGGGHVTIRVFDVTGRRVRVLLDEHRAAGTWTVEWDGTSDRGTHVSSGVYFYRLRAPGFEQTRRMTLVQ